VKKLTKSELRALVARFQAIGRRGGTQCTDPPFLSSLAEEVRLDLPLGELANPRIAGLVLVWRLQGLPMIPGEITDQHQFNAQGLEGAVSIPMPLSMALLVATMVELNRMDVFVPPAWKGGRFCGQGEEEEEKDLPEPGEEVVAGA
jgi:hypothetical protein